MPEDHEQGIKIKGTVTVKSYPAGTLHLYETLVGHGRPELARELLADGKVEVIQKNMVVWSLGYGFDILVQFLISVFTAGFAINNATTLTGTTDGTTAVITFSSTTGISPGMTITGAGIPAYSTVVSVDSSTTITISQNTIAAGTVPLYFTQQNQLGIGWGELGTGNTTPMNTDTALTTPTNRAPVSYAADLGFNEAQLQFFFPDAVLTNQTYYECGSFVGGGSALGSGNLFNHALFATPYVKTAGTDTTLQISFSFSN